MHEHRQSLSPATSLCHWSGQGIECRGENFPEKPRKLLEHVRSGCPNTQSVKCFEPSLLVSSLNSSDFLPRANFDPEIKILSVKTVQNNLTHFAMYLIGFDIQVFKVMQKPKVFSYKETVLSCKSGDVFTWKHRPAFAWRQSRDSTLIAGLTPTGRRLTATLSCFSEIKTKQSALICNNFTVKDVVKFDWPEEKARAKQPWRKERPHTEAPLP